MASPGVVFDRNDIPTIFILIKIFAVSFAISYMFNAIEWVIKTIVNLNTVSQMTIILFIFSLLVYFLYTKGYIKGRSNNNESSFILNTGKGPKVEISNPYRGIFICSGAGGGKSKSLIEPILHQSVLKGFSGIVYDFKFPTLTNEVIHAYTELDKLRVRPVILNFDNPRQSLRVNPLAYLPDISYATVYAETIFSNINPETIKKPDFWSRSAIALLAGGIWYLKEEHPEICTLPHVIRLLLWPDSEAIINKLAENKRAATLIASIRSGLASDKQTAGVFSSLQNTLVPLTDYNITYILSGNSFDLDINNKLDPKLLLIGSNPTKQAYLSPIISLIITSSIKLMNQQKKLKSVVVLDEAPTLYIPNLDTLPAIARSNKISTVFCAQDYSQIENIYGVKKAEIILSNLANQFWGATTNQNTAQKIISKFGKADMTLVSQSKSKSTKWGESTYSKSRSISSQLRDRVTIQEINAMEPGEFYCQTVESKQNEFMRIKFKEDVSSDCNYMQDFKILTDKEILLVSEQIDKDINKLFS